MKKIRMVVFDMAGTTVDEQNLVYKTLHKAINLAGHEISFDQVLLLGAGKEKRQAIVDLLASVDAHGGTVDAVYDNFMQLLDSAYQNADVAPQPGAMATFEVLRLHGIKIVLNTGYNQATAELLLEKLGWQEGREFDLLVTASQVAQSRPYPDMIALAQAKLGMPDAIAVAKVGDSIVDIEEGRNAHCGIVVGITTGAHTREQLESAMPDATIDNLAELLSLLLNYQRKIDLRP